MAELWEDEKKAQKLSYKIDAPLTEFAYIRRENNLTARVEQARRLGVSYGQYMAMLKDGLIADPLLRGCGK